MGHPVLCGQVKGCLHHLQAQQPSVCVLREMQKRTQRCAHIYKYFSSHPPVSRSVVQDDFTDAKQRKQVLLLYQHWPGETETLP